MQPKTLFGIFGSIVISNSPKQIKNNRFNDPMGCHAPAMLNAVVFVLYIPFSSSSAHFSDTCGFTPVKRFCSQMCFFLR